MANKTKTSQTEIEAGFETSKDFFSLLNFVIEKLEQEQIDQAEKWGPKLVDMSYGLNEFAHEIKSACDSIRIDHRDSVRRLRGIRAAIKTDLGVFGGLFFENK